MTFPPKAPVSALNQECQEYQAYKQEWINLDLLADVGTRLKDSVRNGESEILVRRPKEPDDVYRQRVAKFTCQPILPNVVSWYTAKLFEQEPALNGLPASDFWQEFQDDCDRSGTNIKGFASDIFETAFIFSSAYVLTDLPTPDDSVDSLADQQSKGLLDPYCTVYTPLSITNYQTDRYGNLEFIVLKTVTLAADFLGKPLATTEWRYFDRRVFAVYRDVQKSEDGAASTSADDRMADLVDEPRPHALSKFNRVPVRRVALRKPQRLARRAYLQLLTHVNQDNTYDWALFNANLAMPVFIGADMGQPTFAETGYFDLPAGASVQWLEPEGKTFDASQKRLDSLRQEIYRSFHLQAMGRDSSASAAASSGYSKELEMAPAHDMLDGFGELIRAGLQNILIDVADAHADNSKPVNVAWPRYDSAVAEGEIELAGLLDTLDIPSDTLDKIKFRRAAMAYMQDEPEADKNRVKAEIKSAPTKSEQAQMDAQQQVLQFQKSLTTAGTRGLAKQDVADAGAALAA